MIGLQGNLHISIMAIAIAAMLSLLLTGPAAAHPGHHHDRRVILATHVSRVIPNKGGKVALAKYSVMSVPSQMPCCPCCPACNRCAGCSGSTTSMPCGSGASGAAVLVSSWVAGTPVESSTVGACGLGQRRSGLTVGPLDKPPRG